MTLLIAIPRFLFLLLSLLFPQRKTVEPVTYRRLPDKPTNDQVDRWMFYLKRRFPTIEWEWHCRGEFVYICVNAPHDGYLAGLQAWLGGGVIAPCGLVYPIRLS